MGNQSIADELLKLKQLLDMGVLTQEEFDTQKEQLLKPSNPQDIQQTESSEEQVNTMCNIKNKGSFDLSEPIRLAHNNDPGVGVAIMNITGLRYTDIFGLKEYIEKELKAPTYYVCGLKYSQIKIEEKKSADPFTQYANGKAKEHPLVDAITAIDQTRLVVCPTCGKKTGEKIGVVSRGVSVGVFGLASNKLGKTFKCRNCGYTW